MSLDNAAHVLTETPDLTTAGANGAPVPVDHDLPSLAVVQRRYIDRVMARTAHNKTHAARILGIDRRTLNRIIGREEARGASVKIRD